MSNVKAAKDYKDRLSRMIFNDKEKLLELYNAMNGSDYKDASELQVVTLENAIYLSMKNDVAYVLHDELFLYEQQSTKNANEYSCAMKSHFRKIGNQSSGTRKSPLLCLMTYPFLLGYWSRPCRICGA